MRGLQQLLGLVIIYRNDDLMLGQSAARGKYEDVGGALRRVTHEQETVIVQPRHSQRNIHLYSFNLIYLFRSGRKEPPARVNPQNIIPGSIQTTTQNVFILWRF